VKKPTIIYPLLLGAFSVLFLFSNNVALFPLSQLWFPLIMVVGIIALTWMLAYLILRNGSKSALLVALFWTALLSYVQIVEPLQNLKIFGFVLGLNRFFVPFGVIVFLALGYIIIRSRRNFATLTQMLNIASAVLVLISAFNIAIFEYRNKEKAYDVIVSEGYSFAGQSIKEEKLPDIYYLIFDRYASASTLKESYSYDNSSFVNFLKDKGFYVAERSHANYSTTILSLASSLNMNYLILPEKDGGKKNNDQTRYLQRIAENEVLRLLKSYGYKAFHFGSWFWATCDNPNADVNINYSNLPFRGFTLAVFENSALYPFARFFSTFDTGLLSLFDKLAALPDAASPKFVFAHVLLPHDPYLFRRDGQPLTSYEKLSKSEKEKYLDQLIFTTKKIEILVEALLSKSKRTPIIILQSDEGPYIDEAEDTKSLNPAAIRKRTGILNAYYLPGAKINQLSLTITPVNSFRVVCNEYFGTKYKLLENKIYYIKNSQHPFDYTDVTDMITE